MPSAQTSAVRYRTRARRFLWFSTWTPSPEIAERYKELADAYGRLADREEALSGGNN
jgi:hypothetical protein